MAAGAQGVGAAQGTGAKRPPDPRWRHAGIPVVDAHVHVNRFDLMRPGARPTIESNPAFPLVKSFLDDPGALLRHMDAEGVWQAWLINYCARDVMGYGWEVNPWVAGYVQADPERLVAVGGYDPRHDGDGRAAARALKGLGIRAAKLHPVHQRIAADDARLAPFLRGLEDEGLPLIVHTGTSRFPGADNAFANPAAAGRVCKENPGLRVVLAHGGRPDHTGEAVGIVRRHGNAWIDLSGCPPHRLRDYFGDLEGLADRLVWGSDWPGPGVPGMAANAAALLALGLSAKAARAILHGNAQGLLARPGFAAPKDY